MRLLNLLLALSPLAQVSSTIPQKWGNSSGPLGDKLITDPARLPELHAMHDEVIRMLNTGEVIPVERRRTSPSMASTTSAYTRPSASSEILSHPCPVSRLLKRLPTNYRTFLQGATLFGRARITAARISALKAGGTKCSELMEKTMGIPHPRYIKSE